VLGVPCPPRTRDIAAVGNYSPVMSDAYRKAAFKDMEVLVVDDEIYVIRAVELILRDMGFGEVQSTRYPKTALSLIQDGFFVGQPFDFVICDWMMPEMSGIELLQAVRSRDFDLPFIMLTAKATEGDVEEAKGLDVDAYIAKPFTQDQVRRKVATIAKRILSARH